jgi:hypothetical protein
VTPPYEVGKDGSVVLSLGEVCIQTAAKRAHRALVTAILDGRSEDSNEARAVETLEHFLTATDFASLRSGHPSLAGGVTCRVRVGGGRDGAVRWEIVRSE